MRIIPLFALTAFSILPLYAQQPPAKVDEALRARVNEFYTMLVNRQYRQAESLVAEDTKDYFYESKKSAPTSFGIDKIEYAPGFKTAVVTIRGKRDVMMLGAGMVSMEFVDHSKWKLEKGKWCWHFDKDTLLNTPFGRVTPTPPGTPGSGSASPLGPFQRPSAAAIQGGAVQADRNQIHLDARNPQPALINLKNLLPGAVHVSVASPTDGITVSIAKADLADGESTQVTVAPTDGSVKRPQALLLRVLPLNQAISIAIDWAPEK